MNLNKREKEIVVELLERIKGHVADKEKYRKYHDRWLLESFDIFLLHTKVTSAELENLYLKLATPKEKPNAAISSASS